MTWKKIILQDNQILYNWIYYLPKHDLSSQIFKGHLVHLQGNLISWNISIFLVFTSSKFIDNNSWLTVKVESTGLNDSCSIVYKNSFIVFGKNHQGLCMATLDLESKRM